jgi:thioesterase domain-containing protein
VTLRRGAAEKPPLFCLLGVHLYQDLARALDGDRRVIGMHVAIPHDARLGHPRIDDIARRYVDLVRAQQARGPYHLAGLCLGGVVAFEAARQLEAAGEDVPVVAIFDVHLPSAMTRDPFAIAREITGHPLSMTRRLLAALRRRVKDRLAPTRQPPAAEPLEDLRLDDARAEVEMRRYERAVRPISGHLLVFRASGRQFAPWTRLRPDLGWGSLARRVSVHEIRSDHLDVVRKPHVETIAARLGEALAVPAPTGVGGNSARTAFAAG